MRRQNLSLALRFVIIFLLSACSATISRTDSTKSQVLFVCEHGNVKSLMSAEYFNEIAQARNLPYRAISRGSVPDSDTVPPQIIAGLRADGFDVSNFHPAAVTSADLTASSHVILIGTVLPTTASVEAPKTETWTDVPPASINYAAARDSIKSHVTALIDKLERDKAH